jgi:hypothetical protein
MVCRGGFTYLYLLDEREGKHYSGWEGCVDCEEERMLKTLAAGCSLDSIVVSFVGGDRGIN